MRVRPDAFGRGQHDGLRHDGGRLTPLVGGAGRQLLLGDRPGFRATAGFIQDSPMSGTGRGFSDAGLPGESSTWKSDWRGRCFS